MESTKDIFDKVCQLAMDLCYTPNPIRKGWELHEIGDINFELNDNPKFYKNYYLIECFNEMLTKEEDFILWGYGDGLIQKSFYDWMSGRVSLSTQMETTMDMWEMRFKNDTKTLESIIEKRKVFIEKNGRFI
jgi:hypothetical protein